MKKFTTLFFSFICLFIYIPIFAMESPFATDTQEKKEFSFIEKENVELAQQVRHTMEVGHQSLIELLKKPHLKAQLIEKLKSYTTNLTFDEAKKIKKQYSDSPRIIFLLGKKLRSCIDTKINDTLENKTFEDIGWQESIKQEEDKYKKEIAFTQKCMFESVEKGYFTALHEDFLKLSLNQAKKLHTQYKNQLNIIFLIGKHLFYQTKNEKIRLGIEYIRETAKKRYKIAQEFQKSALFNHKVESLEKPKVDSEISISKEKQFDSENNAMPEKTLIIIPKAKQQPMQKTTKKKKKTRRRRKNKQTQTLTLNSDKNQPIIERLKLISTKDNLQEHKETLLKQACPRENESQYFLTKLLICTKMLSQNKAQNIQLVCDILISIKKEFKRNTHPSILRAFVVLLDDVASAMLKNNKYTPFFYSLALLAIDHNTPCAVSYMKKAYKVCHDRNKKPLIKAHLISLLVSYIGYKIKKNDYEQALKIHQKQLSKYAPANVEHLKEIASYFIDKLSNGTPTKETIHQIEMFVTYIQKKLSHPKLTTQEQYNLKLDVLSLALTLSMVNPEKREVYASLFFSVMKNENENISDLCFNVNKRLYIIYAANRDDDSVSSRAVEECYIKQLKEKAQKNKRQFYWTKLLLSFYIETLKKCDDNYSKSLLDFAKQNQNNKKVVNEIERLLRENNKSWTRNKNISAAAKLRLRVLHFQFLCLKATFIQENIKPALENITKIMHQLMKDTRKREAHSRNRSLQKIHISLTTLVAYLATTEVGQDNIQAFKDIITSLERLGIINSDNEHQN